MNRFAMVLLGAIGVVALLVIILVVSAISIRNGIIRADEDVKAAWSEVQNQMKRRADLVPNLVETVKGVSAHEQEAIRHVTEARARLGSMNVNLDNPQQVQQYLEAFRQMNSAISRLLAVIENYPNLKATDAYRDLMHQLEGTENRIGVARNRYIGAVAEYNKKVRTFPGSLFGFPTRPEFTIPEEEMKVPKVDFKK